MAARPRIRRRANWPDNLHEPRSGYYTWRDPRDGKTHILGRVSLAEARHEADEANKVVEKSTSTRSLIDRLEGRVGTIADLVKRMPRSGLKASTLKTRGYHEGVIIEELGAIECSALTTKHVADMLEKLTADDKMTWAKAIRERMISICRRGMSLGWMEKNAAAATERPKVVVKRRRLNGIEEFNAILKKAPDVNDWLENAMLLALVSGQDRSTIARWERSFSHDGVASVQRSKTSVRVDIPLELRLNVLGLSLADVIARCKSTNIMSRYLIHHGKTQGRAKLGSYIKISSLSRAFAEARELAGIPAENAPTFHEIRSLSKRLYDEQGNVDTKALLGHMTDAMAEMYANNRGIAPLKVKITPLDSERILNKF